MQGALGICAGLKANITVKTLDLSWNGFADEGAMAMGEALKTNNTLCSLDLRYNRISERGTLLLSTLFITLFWFVDTPKMGLSLATVEPHE